MLAIGVSALLGYTDYLNLPFSLEGVGQKAVGILMLVGATLFLLLSSEVKKKAT